MCAEQAHVPLALPPASTWFEDMSLKWHLHPPGGGVTHIFTHLTYERSIPFIRFSVRYCTPETVLWINDLLWITEGVFARGQERLEVSEKLLGLHV